MQISARELISLDFFCWLQCVFGCYSVFLSATEFSLFVTMFFWVYNSDAELCTGADISSASRRIYLAVCGCYGVLVVTVFSLFVTVMRASARELIFLVLVAGSLFLFLVVTVFYLAVTVFFSLLQ